MAGILAAALNDPLWKTSVADWRNVLLAAAGFLLLGLGKAPPWCVVVAFVAVSLWLYWFIQ